MKLKDLKKILESASDDTEIKVKDGEIVISEPKPIGYKFKVGDKVLLKAFNQVCTVEKVIDNLLTPAYEVSGWDGILMECAFAPAPQDITERIKTFEDACEWCNENSYDVYTSAYNVCVEDMGNDDRVKDILAYLKLRIITVALNEGWEPSKEKEEIVYVPKLYVPKFGERLYSIPTSIGVYGDAASKLVFKSENLAGYAAEQFADIYADFCDYKKGGKK